MRICGGIGHCRPWPVLELLNRMTGMTPILRFSRDKPLGVFFGRRENRGAGFFVVLVYVIIIAG